MPRPWLSTDSSPLSVFLTSSLMSLSPDPQFHGPELLSALRHLLLCHWHQLWLRDPVLSVLKVHQTEIKSGLVIHAQTPACWWGTREGPSAALPSSQGAPSQAPGGPGLSSATSGPHRCRGTGWPQDGSRIKTVRRDF